MRRCCSCACTYLQIAGNFEKRTLKVPCSAPGAYAPRLCSAAAARPDEVSVTPRFAPGAYAPRLCSAAAARLDDVSVTPRFAPGAYAPRLCSAAAARQKKGGAIQG